MSSAGATTPTTSDNSSETNTATNLNRSDGNSNGSNQNNRRNNRNGPYVPSAMRNFKGKIDSLPVLGTKAERTSQNYAAFLTALETHVLTTFKRPEDIAPAVSDLIYPQVTISKNFPTRQRLMAANGLKFEEGPINETKDEKHAREARNKDINESIELLLKSELTDYTKRAVLAKSNMASLWGIVIGQCTDSLQEQIRAEDEYETNSSNYDSIWLIKTLKKVISGVTAQSNIYHSLFHALKDFYNIRQQDNENVEAYYRRFQDRLQMVGLSHGEIFYSDKLIPHEA